MPKQTVTEILQERQSTHGTFSEAAETVQRLKYLMHSAPNWARLSNTQREALEMIQHKLGRLLYGNPQLLDTVRDIIGYAQLMYDNMSTLDGANDIVNTKTVLTAGVWHADSEPD